MWFLVSTIEQVGHLCTIGTIPEKTPILSSKNRQLARLARRRGYTKKGHSQKGRTTHEDHPQHSHRDVSTRRSRTLTAEALSYATIMKLDHTGQVGDFPLLKGYRFRPTVKPLRFKVTFWSMWKQCVLAPLYKEKLLRNERISILHPPELFPHKPSVSLQKSPYWFVFFPHSLIPCLLQSSKRPTNNSTSGRDPHGSGKCGRMRSRLPWVYLRNVNVDTFFFL